MYQSHAEPGDTLFFFFFSESSILVPLFSDPIIKSLDFLESREFHRLGWESMEFGIVNKGMDFASRRKKWLIALAAFGASSYGLYALYHAPAVARKRRRLLRLLGALVSVAEMISDSADAVGTISRDLKDFLNSDSDEIPRSLRQISKIANSVEFCESLTRSTEALTVGILRGTESATEQKSLSSFTHRASERILSPAGTGFASAVVGSFARNLVLGLQSSSSSSSAYLNLACGEKGREMAAESIRVFVSTAVAVYLDRTAEVNVYDEVFAGLTNPKHHNQAREVLVSLCNGAVETLVRTTHRVLSSGDESSSSDANSGWVATLAVPSNRRFVMDVTGRAAAEAARSVAEFAAVRLSDCVRRSAGAVGDGVAETGLVAVRYFGAKSSVIVTVCLALYLHVLGGGSGVLLPS